MCDECGFRRERAIYGNRGPPRLWASAHHRRFVLDFLLLKQMMVGIGAHRLSTVFCPVLLKSHGPHLFVWWLRHILCVSLSCLCRPRFVWTCVVVDLSWTSLVVYKLMLRPCLCFPAHRRSFPWRLGNARTAEVTLFACLSTPSIFLLELGAQPPVAAGLLLRASLANQCQETNQDVIGRACQSV